MLSSASAKNVGRSEAISGVERTPSAALGLSLQKSDAGKVVATKVSPDSKAYLAGLRPGDQLKVIDGREVNSVEDASQALSEHQPGQELKLVVIPSSEAREFDLRPEGERTSATEPMLGVILRDEAGAVVVSELYRGGPADAAGVRSQDRIAAVANHPITARVQLVRLLREGRYRPGDRLDMLIERDGWERHLSVMLASREQVASLPRSSVPRAPTTYQAVPTRQTTRRYGHLPWTDERHALNIYDVNRRALYTPFD